MLPLIFNNFLTLTQGYCILIHNSLFEIVLVVVLLSPVVLLLFFIVFSLIKFFFSYPRTSMSNSLNKEKSMDKKPF